MEAKISEADFEALVRRAGLPLSAAQMKTVREGYAFIEPMIARIRPERGRAAEPAMTFQPEQI